MLSFQYPLNPFPVQKPTSSGLSPQSPVVALTLTVTGPDIWKTSVATAWSPSGRKVTATGEEEKPQPQITSGGASCSGCPAAEMLPAAKCPWKRAKPTIVEGLSQT